MFPPILRRSGFIAQLVLLCHSSHHTVSQASIVKLLPGSFQHHTRRTLALLRWLTARFMDRKGRTSRFILVAPLLELSRWLWLRRCLPFLGGAAAFEGVRTASGSRRVMFLQSPSHRSWMTSAVRSLHHATPRSMTSSSSFASSCPPACDERLTPLNETLHRYYVAVGSNEGDRFRNVQEALRCLCQPPPPCDDEHAPKDEDSSHPVRLTRTSFLHETAPLYMTNQPMFLNGAVELETALGPEALLRRLKRVEVQLGRDLNGVRNGPRPVDLDILLGEEVRKSSPPSRDAAATGRPILATDSPDLLIPHPRMAEREFVLAPLAEVAGTTLVHPTLHRPVSELLDDVRKQTDHEGSSSPSPVRVLPLPRGRFLAWNETLVMGVLNVTPDSFSDGGLWSDSVERAIERARQLEQDGAHIIDVGGESTRPGAKEVLVEEELHRVLPVIEGIRRESSIPISIDTRHSEVARRAVAEGADLVNDVSGGTHDPDMLPTVAALGVPIVLMHMRGTPETMSAWGGTYEDAVQEVADELRRRSERAERAGIHRWLQVVDPGIGFAKGLQDNLRLLKNLSRIRTATDNLPILIGTSRKGFIGKLSKVDVASDRDPGTIASCVAAICLDDTAGRGCNIVRVHNVAAFKQAAVVMDAIRKSD